MAVCEQNSADIGKWLRLIRADSVGSTTFAKLIKYFGSVDSALGASVGKLSCVDGIGSKTAEAIVKSRDKFDVDAEVELAEKLGVWIINVNDKRYPVSLKKIYDPPPVLYIKGSLERKDALGIAIVGSRRCSIYGQEQASRFAHLMSAAGFTINSGMARGIDTAAHQGALSAGGRTIAVQGCGLANVFPSENKKLFELISGSGACVSELISGSGACISELPLTYEPISENFPPRNRIIAGLSLGVIVIEASARSGAMISARMAMENNREVMAVPGKIDSPLSKGTHQLIKQGAKLIDSIEDIMEALGYIGEQLEEYVTEVAVEASEKMEAPLIDISDLKLSDPERLIYDCLTKEPIQLEQIIIEADLAPGRINASLISLRLKGLIKQLPGNMFRRY